jgi:hypothetical protein
LGENKNSNSLTDEVLKVFNSFGYVKTEIIQGKTHIYTYHDSRTDRIALKLKKMGYEFERYYDVVNESESVLIGWTNIQKNIDL